ncbi:MAG: hypothetical protein CVU46_14475 [Chloroflexi bacterium HGW-Chloroflexi-8]|nr:MAG: hypothetical protein CVU46_14475 [Chloroflexi bacterium HGW-Chloroflexi-8]
MPNWLSFFQLEKISFIFGFITATLFWLIISKSRKWYPEIKDFIFRVNNKFRINQTSGLRTFIFRESLKKAQSNHIAGKLFPLDEIIVTPLLLVPDSVLVFLEQGLFLGEVSTLIPNIPELPQINRNLPIPKITITDAIQGESNLAITGLPGTGKSTCLAYLTSRIAEKNVLCGNQCGKTPFYFHILDSDILNYPNQNLAEIVYKAVSQIIPKTYLPKLAKFIQKEINSNNAIIIIDGIDELFATEADKAFEFVITASNQFPELKFVITASSYYLGKLENNKFLTFQISPFSNENIRELNNKWIKGWYTNIFASSKNLHSLVKEKLISNWVNIPIPNYTPLEYSLFIWGALSGDLKGSDTLSIYQSHFNRILQDKFALKTLSSFAVKFINEKSSIVNTKNYDSNLVLILEDWGIIKKGSVYFYFNHIDLLGYLAGLDDSNIQLTKDLNLISRNPIELSYLDFKTSLKDNPDQHDQIIIFDHLSDYFDLAVVIPWLRHSTAKSPWRINLFKQILTIFQNSNTSLPIKIRLISAFIYANDPSLEILQKQLLVHPDNQLKTIACISISSLFKNDFFDHEVIDGISTYSNDLLKYVVLLLSTHEKDSSLDALARLLLSSDENIRKLIAECLAIMGKQSEELLKDAITMDDILVRRSAIFGLVKLNKPWSYDIIEKLTTEDSQWVIRDLATQAIDYLNSRTKLPIKNRPRIFELNWLIQFAAKQNQSISPESDPTPLLSNILSNGSEQEIIKTLAIIPDYYNDEIIARIIELKNSQNRLLSNAALTALWRIMQTGKNIELAIA